MLPTIEEEAKLSWIRLMWKYRLQFQSMASGKSEENPRVSNALPFIFNHQQRRLFSWAVECVWPGQFSILLLANS